MNGFIGRNTLLERVAAELHDLACQTAQIERALADRGESGAPSASARRIVQELDRVRQTQTGLASLLRALAATGSAADCVPEVLLTRTLGLPSIAERLRTGLTLSETRAETSEPELW